MHYAHKNADDIRHWGRIITLYDLKRHLVRCTTCTIAMLHSTLCDLIIVEKNHVLSPQCECLFLTVKWFGRTSKRSLRHRKCSRRFPLESSFYFGFLLDRGVTTTAQLSPMGCSLLSHRPMDSPVYVSLLSSAPFMD